MSKQLFLVINIIILLSNLNIYISQNIITSWHYDKVQMYDIQKIGAILSSQIKQKVTSLPDFTEDSIRITNLKISNVQQSLYDSYLNFNTGLLLFTPNKVTLSFTFSYSGQSSSGSASFDLKINILKIRIKNNKEDQTQSVTISMFSKESDFTVYEIADKDLLEKVKTALYKGFDNNNILDEQISSKIDILNYYKDFYNNKKSLNFETSSFFGSKKITINFNRFLGFCEDVTGKAESALCYYSGEIDGEDKKDKTKAPINNEKFVNPNGTFNTFINIDLYNKIVANILKEGISEKTFKKDSLSKSLSFDFTVSSLKNYFKGLNSYENNETFEAKIKINELNSKKMKLNAVFNIGNSNDVFSLDIQMDTNLKVEIIRNVRLNICLDNVKNIRICVKSGNVFIIDESGLQKAIEESFINSNESKCLSDDGISLRDYYSIITNAYCQDEGIYLEGNHLYQ